MESPGHAPSSDPIDLEAYRVAKATRDLEINLFWQRSNYFLGWSAGTAAAFFSLKDSTYALPLAIFGLLIALLWIQSTSAASSGKAGGNTDFESQKKT